MDDLRNKLGFVPVDDRPGTDNVAVALCTYFEKHEDRPADDEPDDEMGGWSPWVVDMCHATLDRLAAEARTVLGKPSREGADS